MYPERTKHVPEPKVKVMIPMCEPLETSKCEKCGRVMAEPKELIRIKREGTRAFKSTSLNLLF